MTIHEIAFYTLSVLAIISALGTIFSKSPISSILFLILTFFSISGHYILLNAQFLAVVNIIVYAGAIMVLFLFVVMLMNLNRDSEPQKNNIIKLLGSVFAGLFLTICLAVLKLAKVETMPVKYVDIGLIKNLGKFLFTDFVVPFELTSILFLSGIIGAVYLGKKESKKS